MIAYFDTQAFDRIYRKVGCTSTDVANLRKAVYGRQFSIRLSIHTLEEILLERKVSPQAFAAQIKFTLSLASSRTLVKSCSRLVLDDMRSYGARGEPERPFLPGDMQNAVADGIAALIESDGEELEDDFLAVLKQARREKLQFFAMLDHVRRTAATISTPVMGDTSFDRNAGEAALQALEAMAERAGVIESCRARGLEGLLHLKSVRTSVCAAFAREWLASDPLHHTVSAATVAQTYVTESAANREFLTSFPNPGLNVTALPEFLKCV